ncbi:hypothetical protein AAMO2058_000957600, partial [Amorphochlora amoebiformis]
WLGWGWGNRRRVQDRGGLVEGDELYPEVSTTYEYLAWLNQQNRAHHEAIRRVEAEQRRLMELQNLFIHIGKKWSSMALVQLSRELRILANTLIKHGEDRRKTQALTLNLLRPLIHKVIPGASVKVYGSFATGLNIPSSDLDLVVGVQGGPISSPNFYLQTISKALHNEPWISNLKYLPHASMPLIKAVATPSPASSSIQIDLSFQTSNHRGLTVVSLMKTLAISHPELIPLGLVLKYYLAKQGQGMNDPFQGGLTSYGLILMLVATLKLLKELRRQFGYTFLSPSAPDIANATNLMGINKNSEAMDLGKALIVFLEVYSTIFSPSEDIVEACPPSTSSPSPSPLWMSYIRRGAKRESVFESDGVAIVDPTDSTHNIARSAYNFPLVHSSFKSALQRLEKAAPEVCREGSSFQDVDSKVYNCTSKKSESSFRRNKELPLLEAVFGQGGIGLDVDTSTTTQR